MRENEIFKTNMLDKSIFIVPFNNKTPRFCSREYFKTLQDLKKLKFSIVVFMFYGYNFYRNTLNALILENGKIVRVFGENFTSKIAKIDFMGYKICFSFYTEAFQSSFLNQKEDINLFFIFDNDELYERLAFYREKFKNKVVFVGLNGEEKKFIKDLKRLNQKPCQFYVQKFDKLIKYNYK